MDKETQDRMERLVRRMVSFSGLYRDGEVAADWISEAGEIVALLPEPIDPVVLRAREVCRDQLRAQGLPGLAEEAMTGVNDHSEDMLFAIAGIRAGMEMRP